MHEVWNVHTLQVLVFIPPGDCQGRIVTKFITRGDLESCIGQLMGEEGSAMIASVSDALAPLSKSDILHSELKPRNVLIDTSFRVKGGDFGMSRLMDAMYSRYGVSVQYAAPRLSWVIQQHSRHRFLRLAYPFRGDGTPPDSP